MIDHVSVGVRDLERAGRFYAQRNAFASPDHPIAIGESQSMTMFNEWGPLHLRFWLHRSRAVCAYTLVAVIMSAILMP